MSADSLEELTAGPAMRSRDTGQLKSFFSQQSIDPNMDAQYQVAAFYASQKVWGISVWLSCGADGRPGGWTVWHFLTFSGGLVRQNLKAKQKRKRKGVGESMAIRSTIAWQHRKLKLHPFVNEQRRFL